jgi:hypothetical protein
MDATLELEHFFTNSLGVEKTLGNLKKQAGTFALQSSSKSPSGGLTVSAILAPPAGRGGIADQRVKEPTGQTSPTGGGWVMLAVRAFTR